jgi:hypothetical protein
MHAYMCVYVSMCACVYVRFCVYMNGVMMTGCWATQPSGICMYLYVCLCLCERAFVCVCVYVLLCVYMCIHAWNHDDRLLGN